MTRFKLFFDKDKETRWLNEMSDQGWAMTGFFAGLYTFEACEKGRYRYQVDIGDELFKVSDDYRSFMADEGIEIVQTWGFWIILRKLASDGDFELYTDVDSQLTHYTKIQRMFKIATILEILCLFVAVIAFAFRPDDPLIRAISYPLVILLTVIVFAFIRIVSHTGNIIAELEERKTGVSGTRKQNASRTLCAGLLLNSVALLLPETTPIYRYRLFLVIPAFVLFLFGVCETFYNQRGE